MIPYLKEDEHQNNIPVEGNRKQISQNELHQTRLPQGNELHTSELLALEMT